MIDGDVEISGVDINNLDSLHVLTAIGGNLSIVTNNSLINLSGLDNVTSIGGGILVKNNDLMMSLTGLDNIDAVSIDELNIVYNYSLPACNVQSVCDYLATPNAFVEIHDNATGCNSQTEVEDACWTKVDESVDIGNEIQIFPNPAKNELFISGKDGLIIKEINIYNQMGQRVIHKKGKTNTVDVSMLRQGMYIIEIEIDNGKVRSKLMIE